MSASLVGSEMCIRDRSMAAACDVPARLLYGRWIAELYVLVVFEVYDLEESGLAWGIQGRPVWGWQPSVGELMGSS
eukprot:929217-Alexandrium_andersonii.AAC.1